MTAPRPAVLFSQMEPPPSLEREFNNWYDGEHIPARMALPGFTGARRYVAREGVPRYLAVYELSDLSALETPGYRALKDAPSPLTDRMLAAVEQFTRFIGVLQSDTGTAPPPSWLSVVAFPVPEADREQFDDWYETEHVPLLMDEPAWQRVRRYEIVAGEGGPWTHLAIHELGSPDALRSPARAAARRGPKRAALAHRSWFGRSGRWVYGHLGPARSDAADIPMPSTVTSSKEEPG